MIKRFIKRIYLNISGIPFGWMKYYKRIAKRNYQFSSSSKDINDIEWIVTQLRVLSHEIDKGLAFNSPRKGFGREKTLEMCNLLDLYVSANKFDYQYDAYLDAIEILNKYVENKDNYDLDVGHIDFSRWPVDINRCKDRLSTTTNALYDTNDFRSFALSRHSIRSFDEQFFVDEKIFKQVVEIARTAPSACNRQSFRVSLINDSKLANEVLSIQNGTKGFSNANACVLIMSDLNCYRYEGEMNASYIDGGLFMMNLIYSLKYYGIDSCPLIWDDYSDRRKELESIIDIDKNLLIVGILAVGRADKNCRLLQSPRNDINTIIKKFTHIEKS